MRDLEAFGVKTWDFSDPPQKTTSQSEAGSPTDFFKNRLCRVSGCWVICETTKPLKQPSFSSYPLTQNATRYFLTPFIKSWSLVTPSKSDGFFASRKTPLANLQESPTRDGPATELAFGGSAAGALFRSHLQLGSMTKADDLLELNPT